MYKTLCIVMLCCPVWLAGQTMPDSSALKKIDSLLLVCRNFIVAGAFDNALQTSQIAEETALREWGDQSVQYGRTCFNHGRILYFKGDYPEAEKWYLTAETLQKSTTGKERANYGTTLNNLGLLYVEMGDYAKAETYLLDGKNVREQVLGPQHNDYASSLSNLAVLYRYKSEYERALSYLLEALQVRERLFGRESAPVANVLDNLSLVYQSMGDFEKAEPMALETKNIRAKKAGKMTAEYANSLNNLGFIYFEMGNYPDAQALYEEALIVREKVLGKEHQNYLITLNNLANLFVVTDQYSRAEKLYLELLSIREKTLGKAHPDYAGGLESLAILYYYQRRFQEAESLLSQAKSIREEVEGAEHPEYATLLTNIANVYAGQGRYADALDTYLQGKSIREKILGRQHPDYQESVESLIDLYWLKNDIPATRSTLLESDKLEKEQLIKAAQYLSERQLALFVRKYNNAVDRSMSFARKTPGMEGACYDDLLFYKGFLLNAVSTTRNLAPTDSATIQTLQLLKASERRLAAEYSQPLNERKDVENLEQTIEELNKSLARTSASFGQAIKQVRWEDVQQKLQTTEAAIEFVRFNYLNPEPTDSVLYAALVLLPGNMPPALVPLFEEKQIDALFSVSGKSKTEYFNALYQQGGQAGQTLYNLIWKPLEKYLPSVSTIYFSPSGQLHRLNIGAIPLPEHIGKVVADQYRLIQMGSTRQLFFSEDKPAENQKAVLYGGIRYELDSVADNRALNRNYTPNSGRGLEFSQIDSTLRADSWNYLKWTDVEVNATHALLQDVGMEVSIHRGYEASEESIKQEGSSNFSPRILHVATHGFFFPDPKNRIPTTTTASKEPVFKLSEHPMMRAGLVMAGGNYAWTHGKPVRPDAEDGILTAYEISQFNLRQTELVVLSACETGLGDIQGNEGVYGLQRAFKIAGARHLIMSLWQVPDFQTQELMAVFYENWIEGKLDIPDAFAAAQKAMRDKYKNPFLWAGFILVE